MDNMTHIIDVKPCVKKIACRPKIHGVRLLDAKGIQKSRAIEILGTRDAKNMCDVKIIYKVYT